MADEDNRKVGGGPGREAADKKSSIGVPVAIVIAGALIAVAIYFGGRTPAQQGGAGMVADQPVVGEEEAEVAGVQVGDIREVDERDHVRGAVNPKVTIIEYSDTECPFCKRYHATVQRIVDEYPDDVQWVYRHFPLDVLHKKARKESEAAECAGEQDKFWEMLDLIYETTTSNDGLDLDTLPQLARQAGVVNVQQWQDCYDEGKYAERVEEDVADAEEAGGRGTPYSVLIGPDGAKEPLSGAQPYEDVKARIDSLLQ